MTQRSFHHIPRETRPLFGVCCGFVVPVPTGLPFNSTCDDVVWLLVCSKNDWEGEYSGGSAFRAMVVVLDFEIIADDDNAAALTYPFVGALVVAAVVAVVLCWSIFCWKTWAIRACSGGVLCRYCRGFGSQGQGL
jgi:hypothetical protein